MSVNVLGAHHWGASGGERRGRGDRITSFQVTAAFRRFKAAATTQQTAEVTAAPQQSQAQ